MSNFQIMDYYEGCPLFGGCPSSDEVPSVYDPEKFFIINLAPRSEGGSHWVLLFGNLYFDSFGAAPPMVISPYVERYNTTQFQDFYSAACGYYCIYVADNILASRAPEGDLKFDDARNEDNEQVLRDYFDN